MSYDVLVVGEVLVELSADGPLRGSDRLTLSFSGDALNAAAAAAAAGASVGLLARIGDDELGDALTAHVERCGVSTALLRRVPEPNGMYIVIPDPDSVGGFVYMRRGSAGSTLSPEDVRGVSARALVVSGIGQAISASAAAAVELAARTVSEAGGIVVYDPNFRARLTTEAAAREAFERIAPVGLARAAVAPGRDPRAAGRGDAGGGRGRVPATRGGRGRRHVRGRGRVGRVRVGSAGAARAAAERPGRRRMLRGRRRARGAAADAAGGGDTSFPPRRFRRSSTRPGPATRSPARSRRDSRSAPSCSTPCATVSPRPPARSGAAAAPGGSRARLGRDDPAALHLVRPQPVPANEPLLEPIGAVKEPLLEPIGGVKPIRIAMIPFGSAAVDAHRARPDLSGGGGGGDGERGKAKKAAMNFMVGPFPWVRCRGEDPRRGAKVGHLRAIRSNSATTSHQFCAIGRIPAVLVRPSPP